MSDKTLVEDDEIPEGADDMVGTERVDEDIVVEDPDGEVIDDEDLGDDGDSVPEELDPEPGGG